METFLIHQANDIQGNKQQQILMMMVNASKFSYISNNFIENFQIIAFL